jgi:hypothetical protein
LYSVNSRSTGRGSCQCWCGKRGAVAGEQLNLGVTGEFAVRVGVRAWPGFKSEKSGNAFRLPACGTGSRPARSGSTSNSDEWGDCRASPDNSGATGKIEKRPAGIVITRGQSEILRSWVQTLWQALIKLRHGSALFC